MTSILLFLLLLVVSCTAVLVVAFVTGVVKLAGGWVVKCERESATPPGQASIPTHPQGHPQGHPTGQSAPDFAELVVRCRRYRRERDYLAGEVVRLRVALRGLRPAGDAVATESGGDATTPRKDRSSGSSSE